MKNPHPLVAPFASARPLQEIGSVDAFRTLKDNPFGAWPQVDDPGNRFAAIADPAFKSRIALQPGERIFTIGSCFARNIEDALVRRGFDVPTHAFMRDAEGRGSPVLNNYVPASIAPQIRWAFGMDRFDPDRHSAEVRPGGFIDLQLALIGRPLSREALVARREAVGAVYRELSGSRVVVLTLGLVEAWFDRLSGLYLNMTPPKAFALAHPERFVLHVLEYNQVLAQLVELVDLLGEVCPSDHRMIVTVSPVPLTATFTTQDVAVANSYSKSVLRAAVEALVRRYPHIDYFPSFESVMLSDRATAFTDDQIHVTTEIVRFNVDKMIGATTEQGAEAETGSLERAAAARREGRIGTAIAILREACAAAPDDATLVSALADLYLRHGKGRRGERLLVDFLARRDDPKAHLLLANHYNGEGRHAEAAHHAEVAAASGLMKLGVALARARAYLHLDRCEEGLAILKTLRHVAGQGPAVIDLRARLLEKLGRFEEAEAHFAHANAETENLEMMIGFAAFLEARGRAGEARDWTERARRLAPASPLVLAMRLKLAAAPGPRRGGLLDRVLERALAARRRRSSRWDEP